MDRYYSPSTPEYRAHSRIQEDYLWEDEQGSLNETLIALGASYQALARYISGADIYLMPRTPTDLLDKLKRYAADAIHNTIAQSRRPMEEGGYGRILALAHQSLRSVLATGNNTRDLLNLHVQQNDPKLQSTTLRGRLLEPL
ncbi:uncharacterized protein FOMMEDRAFT_21596 [Fomitiporia mediterranea MF3/22]|uniref:uncharacterized protein n=1 Tax=Fomitiporia mediterranea (strain MF3/22) TaxID=694068 RepID=UPI00044079F9|nr:uncharacterized protein FOMMEDRAFT_21596 [Fomitiporia mediterranea MF3/22]EJD01157.1 hypothetical protein FOMMEDRAFT_21596 [Fomitiporia mediterranea MF3/22]